MAKKQTLHQHQKCKDSAVHQLLFCSQKTVHQIPIAHQMYAICHTSNVAMQVHQITHTKYRNVYHIGTVHQKVYIIYHAYEKSVHKKVLLKICTSCTAHTNFYITYYMLNNWQQKFEPDTEIILGLIFLLKAIRPKDQNLTFAEMVKDKIDSGGLDFDVLRKKVKYSRRSSRRTSLLQPQKRRQR